MRVPSTSGTGSVVSRARQMLPPAPVPVAVPSPVVVPVVVAEPSAAMEGGAPVVAPSSVVEPVVELTVAGMGGVAPDPASSAPSADAV